MPGPRKRAAPAPRVRNVRIKLNANTGRLGTFAGGLRGVATRSPRGGLGLRITQKPALRRLMKRPKAK